MEFNPEVRASGKSSMPSFNEDDRLLFAIPKKGRLHGEVMSLLKGAGLEANRPDRLDVATCKELPVKLVFLPASDIPMYVMDGNVDLGISGSDVLEETLLGKGLSLGTEAAGDSAPVKVLEKLGFGKCRLCLQAPNHICSSGAQYFSGKRVVTSFPHLTKKYFSNLDNGSRTTVKVVSGSVEAACGLGLADAIVDLVETGTTMKAAGLDIVSEVFSSEAVIFKGAGDDKDELIELIMKRLMGYMTSQRFVMLSYNCHVDNLQVCCTITPGKRSPTITELKEKGWHSVSSLVEKSRLNKVLDELSRHNAQDLLVIPLINTRM
jgi:ATP phosphoribosyltransferase